MLFTLKKAVCIGNHMISSAIIWDKSAQVNFSKTNQITICSLKNLRVLIYSKLHEKNHVITC